MNTMCKAGLIGFAGAILLSLGACSSSTQTSSMPVNTRSTAPMPRKQADATCQPDFTFGISQSNITLTAGQTQIVGFHMTSLCGFSGLVIVGVRGISPAPTMTCSKVKGQEVCTSNGPTFKQCCYDFHLGPGTSTGNYITFGATNTTLKTTFTITITGSGSGAAHSATLSLTVT